MSSTSARTGKPIVRAKYLTGSQIHGHVIRPSKAKIVSGHLAHRNGRTGESVVEKYREFAEAAGLISVRKLPVPTFFRDGALWYAERSSVDGVGFTLDGARFIAEEVKSCSGADFDMKELREHQRDFLTAVWNSGGCALLTVERSRARVSVFAWGEVASVRSIAEAHLDSHVVTPHTYGARVLECVRPSLRVAK